MALDATLMTIRWSRKHCAKNGIFELLSAGFMG